jgi:hypothetical protein
MASSLLNRQIGLLIYLTSGDAIFGDVGVPALLPGLHGFDLRLLNLEARFSHEKRMEKIAGVFSLTLELLGAEQAQVVRIFAERCPSISIGRLENARQFHAFLSGLWRFRSPVLPYLPDLAACELAFAEVHHWDADATDDTGARPRTAHAGSRWPGTSHPQLVRRGDTRRNRLSKRGREASTFGDDVGSGPRVRRHPAVALQLCDHDVRVLFETDEHHTAPVKRKTLLAFAIPHGATDVQVYELDPTIFGLVSALGEWTAWETFGSAEEADALLDELVSDGLLEMAF